MNQKICTIISCTVGGSEFLVYHSQTRQLISVQEPRLLLTVSKDCETSRKHWVKVRGLELETVYFLPWASSMTNKVLGRLLSQRYFLLQPCSVPPIHWTALVVEEAWINRRRGRDKAAIEARKEAENVKIWGSGRLVTGTKKTSPGDKTNWELEVISFPICGPPSCMHILVDHIWKGWFI